MIRLGALAPIFRPVSSLIAKAFHRQLFVRGMLLFLACRCRLLCGILNFNGYCPQNVCKLQSSYICGEIANQTKNNEAYNGTKMEIISEMASSEAGFNELMRVLLDSFSKQERALFLEEHKGEQGNGFRPRRWRGHGCSFQLRIPRTRSGAFQPIILGILAAQESERALLFHELYARGLSCEDIAEVERRIYTVTTTANSR